MQASLVHAVLGEKWKSLADFEGGGSRHVIKIASASGFGLRSKVEDVTRLAFSLNPPIFMLKSFVGA
jgi:hypothetical protein